MTHLVLQHLDLLKPLDYAGISSQIDRMIDRKLLDEAGRAMIDLNALAQFFTSPLGQRLLAVPVDQVWREVPFTLGLSPREAGMPGLDAYDADERVQVQGVIDCLIEEDGGLVLIDYKTDKINPAALQARTEFYRPQMRIYAKAVAAIFPQPLREAYLYFITLGRAEQIDLSEETKQERE